MGVTPMIGQNDVGDDRFDLDDAHHLADYAGAVGLARLSMWSINRDGPCSVQFESARVSNTCSGVDQEPQEFAAVFLERSAEASAAGRGSTPRPAVTRDDPETSPYPIWRSSRVYEQGDKIVWRGASTRRNGGPNAISPTSRSSSCGTHPGAISGQCSNPIR